MKTLVLTVALLGACAFSCKKSHDNSTTLSLLQHQWSVISLNGEALRYVGMPGDYYIFSTDGKLYRHLDTTNDTATYNVSADGHTLSLNPVTNGMPSDTATDFQLKTLNDSMLIITYARGIIYMADSLKR